MNKIDYDYYSGRDSLAEVCLEQFHTSYEIPNDINQKLLRRSLIREEWEEVDELYGDDECTLLPDDRLKLAKELADLLYVVHGTALVENIDLQKALQLVHESNMSKLGDDDKPIRRSDGKILKGPSYFEPDMSEAVL